MTPTMTLVTRYISGRTNRAEITRGTAHAQRRTLRTFADVVGRRPVERLSRRDVERWMATRSHVSPGTLRLEFGQVRAFARWLDAEGHTRHDVTAGMRTPQVPRLVPRALTRAECDAIAAVLPDARARAIYALMRRCGLRRAEVASLQVGDWDRVGRCLTVVGKGGHQRLVPVPTDVSVALDAYVVRQGGPLIRAGHGGHLTPAHLSRLMRTWMVDAGVKARPWDGRACHSLRHSIASEVAETSGDVRIVQDLLGHQSLTSTQIYLRRVGLARVRAALELAGQTDELARKRAA